MVARRGQASGRSNDSSEGNQNTARMGGRAYARILEMLFDREIPAGAFVSQSQLVELVGMPIAALRDALKLLEAEGIVVIHPRSGIQFVKPGVELTRSTFQFRIILERAAAAAYAQIADENEVGEIWRRHQVAIARLEREGLTEPARAEVEALEELLHGTVVQSLSNPLIESAYRRLHSYVRLIRLNRNIAAPLVLASLREHVEILGACKVHDANSASSAMQAHLTAALHRSLGLFGY